MTYKETIGTHNNYPNVLGETTTGQISEAVCPPLELRSIDENTVTFEPLQIEMFDINLTATGEMTGTPQNYTVVKADSERIEWGNTGKPAVLHQVNRFRITDPIEPGDYQVGVEIDATTAAEILDIEREHKNDAEYAFQQTIGHLQASVAKLAGRSFTGASETAARQAALRALASAVGEQFVPAYPMVLGGWSALARKHCGTLVEQSKNRDTSGNHTSSWTARVRGDRLLLVPLVPEVRVPSSRVLSLAELRGGTPDWTAESPPTCPFAAGQEVVVDADLRIGARVIPAGWLGSFVANNSSALGNSFDFALYPPDQEDKVEQIAVPADQLGSLRVAAAATSLAAPGRQSPFREGQHVKTTRRIPSSDGDIPAGAIGEFYDATIRPARLGSFDFRAVLRDNGRQMSGTEIAWDDLEFLQPCDDPLPERVERKVAANDGSDVDEPETDVVEDDAGAVQSDQDDSGNDDDDEGTPVPGPLAERFTGVVLGGVNPLWARRQGSGAVSTLIADGLRAARDNARNNNT